MSGRRGVACAELIAAARPGARRDSAPRPRSAHGGPRHRASDRCRHRGEGRRAGRGGPGRHARPYAPRHRRAPRRDAQARRRRRRAHPQGRRARRCGSPDPMRGPMGICSAPRNDAILVGRGTILADDPSLTCRLPGMSCRSPVRVVLDRRLRTPPEARLFDDLMVPVWLVCAADEEHPNTDALQDRGAEIVPVPGRRRRHARHATTRSRRSPAAASPACWSRAALRSRARFSTPT